MQTNNHTGGTLAGTAGGTLLSVLASLGPGDVLKTMVLAAIGAITSFFISLLLKWALRKLRIAT
jgi:mannitol-specific phosphotransferase system IIBC component